MKAVSIIIAIFLVFPVACNLNNACPDFPRERHEIIGISTTGEKLVFVDEALAVIDFQLALETEKMIKARLGGMYSANAADFSNCPDAQIAIESSIISIEVAADHPVRDFRTGQNIFELFTVEQEGELFNPGEAQTPKSDLLNFRLSGISFEAEELTFLITLKLDNAKILQTTARIQLPD